MCQEILEIVQKMDLKDIELQIALQCAPLIAGIKISNLLIVPATCEDVVRAVFKHTKIAYFHLWRTEEKTAFLMFRRSRLENYLGNTSVHLMLRDAGYETCSLGYVLRQFKERYEAYTLREGQFPHEIGLLLGYPAEDVKGFIEHGGENYLFSGYWKVYARVEQKKILFRKYEEARETMIRLLANDIDMRLILELYHNTLPNKQNKQAG